MPHSPFYQTQQWLAARAAQLARQPHCEVCLLLSLRTRATEVDHRKSLRMGGHPFDPRNLRSLCKTHHSQKTIMLDGQHSGSGKQLVVTGPDGWPIDKEGPETYGTAENQFNPQAQRGRRRT